MSNLTTAKYAIRTAVLFYKEGTTPTLETQLYCGKDQHLNVDCGRTSATFTATKNSKPLEQITADYTRLTEPNHGGVEEEVIEMVHKHFGE